MKEDYIKKKIKSCEKDLYPSLGKIHRIDISDFKTFIFSEICCATLYYEATVKYIVIKRYLNERRQNEDQPLSVQNEYKILKYLFENFSTLSGINVIKPLIVLSTDNILITEEFKGSKLNNIITNDVRWIPSRNKIKKIRSYFFQAGKWLKQFQEFTKEDKKMTFKQDIYTADINKKLSSLSKYYLNKDLHNKILRFIRDRFKRIGDQELVLVGYHGDFTPWNVLEGDNEIRVMDLDRYSHRNRYDDLTLFLALLEGKKSILGMFARNIDILKEAFLKGYGIEDINYDIFDLLLLKNTLKALNMINLFQDSNSKTLDILYERYRKRRRINLYSRYIGNLIDY